VVVVAIGDFSWCSGGEGFFIGDVCWSAKQWICCHWRNSVEIVGSLHPRLVFIIRVNLKGVQLTNAYHCNHASNGG